jgi:hypothetical protein
MPADYVLDTSAIRSLGATTLACGRKGASLVISPVTAYELFSHLEDPPEGSESPEDRFARNRGLILLAKDLCVLEDPFAELGSNCGARDYVNPTRFEEAHVVSEAIRTLASSSTLTDFYSREVRLSDGAVGTLADLGRSIAATLDHAEQEFETRVLQYNEILKRSLTFDELRSVTPTQLHAVIEQGVDLMAEAFGVSPDHDRERLNTVRAGCYLHLGYLAARSIEYSVRAGPFGKPTVDKNDYEDGLICCHLTLATDRVLVAGDSGIRTSLHRALEALRNAGFEPACRMLSIDEFRDELSLSKW